MKWLRLVIMAPLLAGCLLATDPSPEPISREILECRDILGDC